MENIKEYDIKDKVRQGYAKIAESGSWLGESSCSGGGCCGGSTLALTEGQLVTAIGYSSEELAGVPSGANMGLSCGNPNAVASLQPGEVVLDLGSGGGFDCFIAGPKVGSTGRVIGVDMTAEMIGKARASLPWYRNHSGLDNVEFRLGEIEHLPVADSSVDVVISNCVINLSPNKQQVWNEISRVLKPGGRVAVSDLALLKPLPKDIVEDIEALVGCVAGADLVSVIEVQMKNAGLKSIELKSKPEYVKAMTNWEDPLYKRIVSKLPAGAEAADFITSLDITAKK